MSELQSAKGPRTRTSVFRGRGMLPRRPSWHGRTGHQGTDSRGSLARVVSHGQGRNGDGDDSTLSVSPGSPPFPSGCVQIL